MTTLLMKQSNIAQGVYKITLGQPEAFVPSRFKHSPSTELGDLPSADAPFDLEAITCRVMSRGCVIKLPPVKEEENFFGLGLQLQSFAHTGQKRTLRVNSDPKASLGDSHAPAPFYLSTAGYAVLIDTARYATFYFGTHQSPHAEAGTDKSATSDIKLTEEALYSQSGESQNGVTVDIPGAKGVDIYVFAGPHMRDALQRYNLFSGGGCLPPLWGLGVWYRGCGKADQARAESLMDHLREREIPCDVFGLEPGWQSKAYSCSLKWDDGRFPDHHSFLQHADALNYHVNLWEHAFIHPTSPLYKPLGNNIGECTVWEGKTPDFADEQVQELYSDYHRREFVDKGVSGFKLDECDNSDWVQSPWSFPEWDRFPSGQDGEQMHSMFGVLYQQAIEKSFRDADKLTYSAVRSSGAWSAPYPFVLYSDLYDHREFMRGMCTAGVSGMLWCPEVRTKAVNPDDLIRRLQTMVLSPQFLINAWTTHNPPWWQIDPALNNDNIPMENWERLESRVREWCEWRMRFIPYLYAAFARYAQTGLPPFRPLIVDYPEDERFAHVDDQWMAGESLMVAPLTVEETSRTVILPEGKWYAFGDDQIIEGGGEIVVETDSLPIFIKSGHGIALANTQTMVGKSPHFDLTFECYGTKDCEIALVAKAIESYTEKTAGIDWLRCTISDDAVAITGESDLYSLGAVRHFV